MSKLSSKRKFMEVAMRQPHMILLLIVVAMILNGCATLPGHEPIQVNVVGIESLPGEGLEVRMLVKLRIQNPNEAPIDYDGVSLNLNVQGQTYASGVGNQRGTIPRFGEAVIEVPVTISTLRLGLQAFGLMRDGNGLESLKYTLNGRLGGAIFGSMSFSTEGELKLSP